MLTLTVPRSLMLRFKVWRPLLVAVAAIVTLSCSVIEGITSTDDDSGKAPGSVSEEGMVGDWSVAFTWCCSAEYEPDDSGTMKYCWQANLSATRRGWQPSAMMPGAWHLNDDGTFLERAGNRTGTWILEDSRFTIAYDVDPYATYTGQVSSQGSSIEGTMETQSGDTGCWTAEKAD
jgi:hypothetical protein